MKEKTSGDGEKGGGEQNGRESRKGDPIERRQDRPVEREGFGRRTNTERGSNS